eukprot:TRINITY_DN13758_c0_g1_i2.p1 TRINITY_DN13758_c0_g1~~TRINITY_DN13758_c0_g1_i2.p1  ORF type:complete len:215 (-),score=42.33 TRINITY_DN13758_c0_g1_i2:175-819(-)
MSYSTTEMGGLREAVCAITGNSVFAYMKWESGVHRVQRVPVTENNGRLHTSTMTVAVLPQPEESPEIEIPAKDLKIDTFRSGGAGGQHVNTTDSAIRITHLPTGIVSACQNERSQHLNKRSAMKLLMVKLNEHNKKQLNCGRDEDRKAQIGTGDRSERIRTYNFPQDRITDHRLSQHNFHGIESLLEDGTLLKDIHEALIGDYQMKLVEKISSE